jgi:hypothetical protein
MSDLAIVGEQQQTLGLAIEPADWHDPTFHADEVHNRVATTLVVHRRDVALGLVEQDVAPPLVRNEIPVYLDLLALCIDFRAKFGHDNAIDANPSFNDHFFCPAARRDTARREDSLQSFHAHLVLVLHHCASRGYSHTGGSRQTSIRGCSQPRGHRRKTSLRHAGSSGQGRAVVPRPAPPHPRAA